METIAVLFIFGFFGLLYFAYREAQDPTYKMPKEDNVHRPHDYWVK